MHHIQAKILEKLLYVTSLNYAAMRPAGVESNHFAYHLQQLIKAHLIEKRGADYTLTPQGLAYIDRLSHKNMDLRLQPHIATCADITTASGKTLLFKRHFQPYIHRPGFPLGKVHMGETVAEAAEREVREKTGLTDIPLVHRGIVYIEGKAQDFTISKILCHVFQGKVEIELPTIEPTFRGSCEWMDISNYKADQLMPGFLEVKQLLASSPYFFFAEITAEVAL